MALSHARICWPLLLPVHDAVRDGYHGVAVVAPGGAGRRGGATLKLDTDSLHSSRLPQGLLRLDQQLLLFAKQLAAAGAPDAAAACRAAAGAELEPAPASMAAGACDGPQSAGRVQVQVALRHCYAVPAAGDESGTAAGHRCSDALLHIVSPAVQ